MIKWEDIFVELFIKLSNSTAILQDAAAPYRCKV